MTCDFAVTFEADRLSMLLTHTSGTTFGTLGGTVAIDATPAPVTDWKDKSIQATVPTTVVEGNHTITVTPLAGVACSKNDVYVPPAPTDPVNALVRVDPLVATFGEPVRIQATGLVFEQSAHAPLTLRDRSDKVTYTWTDDRVAGWGSQELELTLPTLAEYEGDYDGTQRDQYAHTIKLGLSQYQPAFVLLPAGFPGTEPLPCDPEEFEKWMASAAKLTVAPKSLKLEESATAIAVREGSIDNPLGPLLQNPSSGYRLDLGLQVLDAADNPASVLLADGELSVPGEVKPTSSATFRLPPSVASPGTAAAAYTVELVGQLTTPATVCAEAIVKRITSEIIKQLPLEVPPVLVLFDRKTPPFDNSSTAGDALIFVRTGMIPGLATGTQDARNGNPGAARSAVVTILRSLIANAMSLAALGFSGLPLPPVSQLLRLSTIVTHLEIAPKVAVVVASSIPNMKSVVLEKGLLWDYDADDWVGSGFIVGPPGTSVRANADTGNQGEQCTFGVPSNSILSDSPSLWNPSNTTTVAMMTSGSGNWYNRISSLRWN